MSFKPLIIDTGVFKQLPSGQALDAGGWILPASGGTVNYLLMADVSGNAVWGSDVAGLTSLTVDNITINGFSITSDIGTIIFNDENLTTTGTVSAKTLYLDQGTYHYHGDGAHTYDKVFSNYTASNPVTGTLVIDLPNGYTSNILSFKVRGYSYRAEHGPWEVTFGGIPVNASPDFWDQVRAFVSGQAPFIMIRAGYNGNTGKACLMLGTTTTNWYLPITEITDVISASGTSTGLETGWDIAYYADETNFYNNDANQEDPEEVTWNRDYPTPSADNEILVSFADKQANWITVNYAKNITEDTSIYVRKTGNDTTGDGSFGLPYLTVERAITHTLTINPGVYFLTVDIGEGIFSENTITYHHSQGTQIVFLGVSEQITSQAVNSIAGGTTSLGSNLSYYDVTFILPVGKSVTVGDYISIGNATGGSNPKGLYGCHYVSGWVGGTRTATIQVVFRDGSSVASGAVTCDIDLIKTVLAFTASNGLNLNGLVSGGFWIGMVFQGSDITSHVGINMISGASVTLQGSSGSGFATGVVGFGIGVQVQINAGFNGEFSFISKCGDIGIQTLTGGTTYVQNSHISGVNNEGVTCLTNSTFIGTALTITGVGNYSVYAIDGAYVSLINGNITLNNATYAIGAFNRSTINITGSTFTDSVTPATNGNNEDSWLIGP